LSLRTKTMAGMSWSLIDKVANNLILFVIGIILARLLSPTDYGIVGLITVFIAVSQTIVESGLSEALIRKRDCSEIDYNTMFYTNIAFGVITFIALFAASGFIARFYNKAELSILTKVMAINLVINSFGLIETAILTKTLNFKTQAKVSVISSTSAGLIAIILAFLGFGYWSLAVKTLLANLTKVLMLRYYSSWRPKLQYSIDSFKDMFSFGIKLLASSLIDTIYKNVYQMVIGKSFSLAQLGLYTRAMQFRNLPATNITSTVQRVSYPVLASLSHDVGRVRNGYKKLIRLTFYLTSLAMLGLLICSKEVVILLVGQKWAEAIPFLQIMCLSGCLYPLHALNLNMMKAMDKPNLCLRVSIYKKLLAIPVIIIGVRLGMLALVWGMALNSFSSFLINSMFSEKIIGYSSWKQLGDILPALLENGSVMIVAYLAGTFLTSNLFASLAIKIVVALILVIALGEFGKLSDYKEIKKLLLEQLSKTRFRSYLRINNS